MLNQFKVGDPGALGEYIIDDWNKTGYTVVMIAPTFPNKTEPDWGRGTGSWTVDYPDTSTTFWSLMKKYEPIAVMTTSRNQAGKKWVLEIGAKNLAKMDWIMLPFNGTRRPFVGAGTGDPASAAGLPNNGQMTKDGDPPDATRAADPNTGASGRDVSANATAIQDLIMTKLNAEFAAMNLEAVKDTELQGIGNDAYVSAFAGYHAVWYDAWKDSCKAGWHTHVDYGITVPNAAKAIKLQLEVLIKWLNEN